MAKKKVVPSVRAAVRAKGDFWPLAYKPGKVLNSLRGLSAIAKADFKGYVSAKLFMLGKAAGVPIAVRVNYYSLGG